MTFAKETPAHLEVDEFCFFTLNTDVASGFRFTSNSQLRIYWSPLLHHSHNSTDAIYQAIGQPKKLLMSDINSLHLIWSFNNKQERQWNPPLAISNSRYNNSNIRTLIHFNIDERKIHLSSIVSLTNDLFDYLYLLRRLCVAWMSKKAYLDEASNTLRSMVHQTATCLHSLSAALYGPHERPESGISSTSWCQVDSSSHPGLSCAQLRIVGGDHSPGYRSHQDLY